MSSLEKGYGQGVELESVYTVYGYLAGQVIKTKLESEDIPALLRYESVGHVLGITVDGLGEVQVMVPKPLAAQARAVLANAEPIFELPTEEGSLNSK